MPLFCKHDLNKEANYKWRPSTFPWRDMGVFLKILILKQWHDEVLQVNITCSFYTNLVVLNGMLAKNWRLYPLNSSSSEVYQHHDFQRNSRIGATSRFIADKFKKLWMHLYSRVQKKALGGVWPKGDGKRSIHNDMHFVDDVWPKNVPRLSKIKSGMYLMISIRVDIWFIISPSGNLLRIIYKWQFSLKHKFYWIYRFCSTRTN